MNIRSQAQAKRLFLTIAGRRWREGDTTSETADGTVYAYAPGMRLLGKRDPNGGIVPVTGPRPSRLSPPASANV